MSPPLDVFAVAFDLDDLLAEVRGDLADLACLQFNLGDQLLRDRGAKPWERFKLPPDIRTILDHADRVITSLKGNADQLRRLTLRLVREAHDGDD